MKEVYDSLYKMTSLRELVTDSSQSILALLSGLPSIYSQFWGVEIDLLCQNKEADLLLEIVPKTAAWLLPGHVMHFRQPGNIVSSLLANKSKTNSMIVRNIWLEFDFRGGCMKNSDDSCPSLFLGPQSQRRIKEILSILVSGLSLDLNLTNIDGVIDRVHRIICEVSEDYCLDTIQIGVMYSRLVPSIRIVFKPRLGFIEKNFFGYLSGHAGFRGLGDTIDYLKMICPLDFPRCYGIDIDLSGNVTSALGLEVYNKWMSSSDTEFLLDKLEAVFHVDASKSKAIRRLTERVKMIDGIALINSSRKAQHHSIQDKDAVHSRVYTAFCDIGLHHVKLGFRESSLPTLKAYIGVLTPHLAHDDRGRLILSQDLE